MTATSLLDRCRSLDVHLWVEGGRLRFDAPAGALDPAFRADLQAHKPALVELLSSPWSHLETLRWGPAIGDPSPGIIVGHPAPEMVRGPEPSPSPVVDPPSTPSPFDFFGPPRVTPWGTVTISAPNAEPIALFGPPPAPVKPQQSDANRSIEDPRP